MPEHNFTDDLRVLVTAYLPIIETLKPVEKLVLAQTAVYLEMDEAMKGNSNKEERHDLG